MGTHGATQDLAPTYGVREKPNANDTCLVVWQTGETVTSRDMAKACMSIYSDWRNDKLFVLISVMTLVATLAVPFLGRVAVELSWWTNLLFGAAILVIGGIGAYWRLRAKGRRKYK